MKRILVTGALGQVGSELVLRLRQEYGKEHVLATDIRTSLGEVVDSGPFEIVDVTNGEKLQEVASSFKADTIIHLAALLSAVAETKPLVAWNLNMNGLINALETARQLNMKIFVPSSIAAFGPSTPKTNTPQTTIQRPETMYGINKVSGELLCEYYFKKYKVDTRGVRFPGLISHLAPPGGGTTDYAVEIYYDAVQKGSYISCIQKGTYLDMMYMPDALEAIINLMEADPNRLKHRNAYNITSMSLDPEAIAKEIQKHIPHFSIQYKVEPIKQIIADSWPNSLDDTCARTEWGYNAEYDLSKMTADMLDKIEAKLERSPS
ncbi:L-threonine 3-dehydrogenase [Siminovitchia sp. FSL W7-1587]|uniref:L-threonine 3-dehydrogenase n=1 Tax=Siminovitchia sp. FSL W7-1587 TaxID=2954699 RepID=UPI0030CD7672